MKKQKILIPMDGSDFSSQIVPSISKFFPPDSTEIVLFEAIDPEKVVLREQAIITATDMIAGTLANKAEESRKRQLEAEKRTHQRGEALIHQYEDEGVLADCAAMLDEEGYKVTPHAEVGEAAECIVRYAGENDVDLIAMATHGRSGLTRLLMGSVAEKVLHEAPVPVILIRPS